MRPSQDPSITRKSHNRGKVVSSFLRDTSHRSPGADVPKNVLLPNRGYEVMTIRAEDNRSGGFCLSPKRRKILRPRSGGGLANTFFFVKENYARLHKKPRRQRRPPHPRLLASQHLFLVYIL